MATELIMPDLGTTTGDMKVIRILKNIGDYVKLGEPIIEVQTDKANVEVESYTEGYLKHFECKEGDVIAAGTPIAIIGEKDEVIEEPKKEVQAVEEQVIEKEDKAKEHKVIDISAGISIGVATNRVFATPLARKMAKDAAIDITTIKGSGPGGRIVKDDVLAAIKASGAVASTTSGVTAYQAQAQPETKPFVPPTTAPQGAAFVEMTKIRKTIATRLTYSFKEIPHFYLSVSVNMESAVAMKKRLEDRFPERKFTYTDLLIKIVEKALAQFPEVNTSYQDGKITQYSRQNISLAISTDDGLITPTLIDLGALSLAETSLYSKDVVSRTRSGKLSAKELEPAAITISNLGMFGIEEFQAIINPPQSSILAVGAIINQLKLRNGVVCEVPHMKAKSVKFCNFSMN
jgi:pyruvate dehydrogenase E2 component (dihydrolipoamide acetyltransferase)